MNGKKPLAAEIAEQQHRGVLLVLTGPTGAGKDEMLSQIQKRDPTSIRIKTTTTRAMRENEYQEQPYFFISREEFEKKIARKDFFEWMEFRGEYYGTQKQTLSEAMEQGVNVIWRIDTKGVKNSKEKILAMTERAAFIFLISPLAVLKERVLRDEREDFAKRWREDVVLWEMEQYDDCDYVVVNTEGQIEKAVDSILSIMQAKRLENHIAK